MAALLEPNRWAWRPQPRESWVSRIVNRLVCTVTGRVSRCIA